MFTECFNQEGKEEGREARRKGGEEEGRRGGREERREEERRKGGLVMRLTMVTAGLEEEQKDRARHEARSRSWSME